MGGCNSSGTSLGQNLEKRCTRRGKTSGSSSSSSSSSSPSSNSSSPSRSLTSRKPSSGEQPLSNYGATGTEGKMVVAANDKKKQQTAIRNCISTEEPLKPESVLLIKAKGEEHNKVITKKPDVDKLSNNHEDDERQRRETRLEKLKEGVDFIETEEDAEAVESAVVKIQSTFRGKKIRSKLGQKQAANNAAAADNSNQQEQTNNNTLEQGTTTTTTKPPPLKGAKSCSAKQEDNQEELSKKVATMQVNDNSSAHEGQKDQQQPTSGPNTANLPEDEADRAATKIQAGFKGYKTRKELEGKLSQQMATSGSQQSAEGEQDNTNKAT